MATARKWWTWWCDRWMIYGGWWHNGDNKEVAWYLNIWRVKINGGLRWRLKYASLGFDIASLFGQIVLRVDLLYIYGALIIDCRSRR